MGPRLVVREKNVDWITYFSLNNIELDILLNTMFINFNEKRACTIKDYVSKTVFDKLNPNLVYKLVNKGILRSYQKGDEVFFTLTSRGIKAFFSVVHPVFDTIEKNPGVTAKEVSTKIALKTLFGGVYRVYSVHEKIVEKILLLLLLMGFIQESNGSYKPRPIDYRIKSIVDMLKRLSSTIFIRKPDDLVLHITKSLNVPVDRVSVILSKLALSGIVTCEKDPAKALADLLTGLEARANASLKEGRLLEAAAYEALAIVVTDVLLYLKEEQEQTATLKNKHKCKTYEHLGDYFYHNLFFEVAQLLYNRAVNIAKNTPGLSREVNRCHTKYVLSKARHLAQQKKYREALTELQRLIDYFSSKGSFREADIVKALCNELQAELELMQGRSCLAKDLFFEASQIYSMLGGEYINKAKALYCKALISKGECKLLVEKNVEEAYNIFKEAIDVANEILSPHLKNVALSWYYEAKARINVNNGKLNEAAKDFEEAAKYYQARGIYSRALLSFARAKKFHGFHLIFSKEFDEARKYMELSKRYYLSLLRRIMYRNKNRYYKDIYLFNESLKGVCDTYAFINLIDAIKLINEVPIVDNNMLASIVQKLEEASHYLLESSRDEYYVIESVYATLKQVLKNMDQKMIEAVVASIDRLVEKLYGKQGNMEYEPRRNSIRLLLSLLLTRLRYLITTLNRWFEEDAFL